MASLIYNSALEDEATGLIDYDTDTFKVLLVTSSYTPDKDTHTRRDDITNEVANGNGYTTGGAACTATVALDTANDRLTITFSAVDWTDATFTARGAVIYKSTGTAADDPLIFYNDFGADISRTAATFSIAASVITKNNT